MDAAERDWRREFNEVFAEPESAVVARIWQEVLGDEYPAELSPHSCITRSELRRIAHEVDLAPGDRLVDLGCGRGGVGIWVARQTGARLTGIDISDAAVAAASDLARRLGVDAAFRQGTFEATGLADESADAVMSVDALLFTPSKAAALAESRRVLRAGGRLVFTTWDYHSQPGGRPPQVADHRPLLTDAGFEVLLYEETPGWRLTLARTGAMLLAAADALAAEAGVPADKVRQELEEENATIDAMSRRVLVVARTL